MSNTLTAHLEIAAVLLERALVARDMAEGRHRIASSAYSRDEITAAEWHATYRTWGVALEDYQGALTHYTAVRLTAEMDARATVRTEEPNNG